MSGIVTIVRVDPDDELPAILDRLPGNLPCVVVLPPHSRALSSVVGAKLLARRAEAAGARIAVVSDDRAVTAHVRAAGLPVASTVEEAQRLLGAQAASVQQETGDTGGPAMSSRPLDAGTRDDGAGGDGANADGGRGSASPATTSADGEPGERGKRITEWRNKRAYRIIPGVAARETADADANHDQDGQHRRDRAGQPLYTDVFAAPVASDDADDRYTDEDGNDQNSTPVRGYGGGTGGGGGGGGSGGSGGSSGSSSARRLSPMATAPRVGTGARARRVTSGDRLRGLQDRLRELGLPEGIAALIIPALIVLVVILLFVWLLSMVISALTTTTATLALTVRTVNVPGYTSIRALSTLPRATHDATHIQMYSTVQTAQDTIDVPVHGIQIVPDHTATGEIELANPTTYVVKVPAGTTFGVPNSSVGYVTTQDARVPAAQVTFNDTRHGAATVSVRASVNGAGGNVAAATISVPPAQFQSLIVTNTVAVSGGTDLRLRTYTPRDASAAATTLFARLDARARAAIIARLGKDVALNMLYVARAYPNPILAPDRRSASLTLSIVYHAVYVYQHDLLPAATNSLRQTLALQPSYQLIPRSVTWTPRWQMINANVAQIDLSVTGRSAPPDPIGDIVKHIAGQSVDNANAYLQQRPDIVPPSHLSLSPSWSGTVPGDISRIHVTEQQP